MSSPRPQLRLWPALVLAVSLALAGEKRLTHEIVHAALDGKFGSNIDGLEASLKDLTSKNPHLARYVSQWRIQYGAEFIADMQKGGATEEAAKRAEEKRKAEGMSDEGLTRPEELPKAALHEAVLRS